MPGYRRLGNIPPKHHIEHVNHAATTPDGVYYEHVITTAGFSEAYSLLYHLRPPTVVLETALVGTVELNAAPQLPLQHHHLRTAQLPRRDDFVSGRLPLLFNEDLVCYRCRPEQPQEVLYRNAAADEVIFIQAGKGVVETQYGRLPYRRGDYVVIPRTTIFRLQPDDVMQEDYLIIECLSPVRTPARYNNPNGQFLLGTPYSERDFHSPTELLPIDDPTPTPVLTKDGQRMTRMTMAHHPLDVVGWDGHLYPYTINAWDFEPLTGTVHLPPPFQQTFECRGFVICTFAPRHLDHHPQAVKVPYAHSNVEACEVLFYVDGQFGSRRGVDTGSLTLHPAGIPHGPHPGTLQASRLATRTEEMAVMFDTERPLQLTSQAMEYDDPEYPLSWAQ